MKPRYFRRPDGIVYRMTGETMDVRLPDSPRWFYSAIMEADMEPLGAVEISAQEGEPS